MKQVKENKVILVLLGLLILIFLVISIALIINNTSLVFNKNQTVQNISIVCFKQACFDVEVVQTAIERQRGLMFRDSLDSNVGMLFVFEESSKYGFWMKNTLIPLDIIWIDENKTITDIKENVLPCESNQTCPIYSPSNNALYVLEINSGKVKENNLSVGDEGIFN